MVLFLVSVATEDLSIGSSSEVHYDYDEGDDEDFPPGFGDFPDDMFPEDDDGQDSSDGAADPGSGTQDSSSDPNSSGGAGDPSKRKKRSTNATVSKKTKGHHKLKRTNSASSALGNYNSLIPINQPFIIIDL